MFKNPNHFIQFELWKDCSLGCKFCCNKNQPKIDKIESLHYVLDILNSEEIKNYNEIGLIGGEFFNGELDNPEVYTLFNKILETISLLDFDKIYITTALMFDLTKFLNFVSILKNLKLIDKTLICTSYDTKYRFYTKEREELWKNNMKFLCKNFPELRVHTEIILTQSFINEVLENRFNICEFEKEFNTKIDFIEPSSGLGYYDKIEASNEMPDFFPTKSSFIQFLKKSIENNWINLDTFLSMELRSNKLYFIADGKRMVADNRREGDGKCPIPNAKVKYDTGFIDSNTSMSEVVREYKEMFYEY